MKSILITLLFLVCYWYASAQSKPPGYSVFLDQYKASKPDTNRVRLLLKMDSIYLYRLSDTEQILDSALLMGQQALALSTQLHFNRGIHDATFLIANTHSEKMNFNSAIAVMEKTGGVLRLRLLRMLGERFLYRLGKRVQNLDSAYIFIREARDLSESYSPAWRYQTWCLLGKYLFCRNNTDKGIECFMTIIRELHQKGNTKLEAFWWSELALYLPTSNANYATKVKGFETAISLYQQIGILDHGLWVDLALVHEDENELGLAEAAYVEGIKQSKIKPDENVSHLYSALARLNLIKGDYHKTIYYSQEAVKKIDSLKETSESSLIYYTLAESYRALGETEKSVYWYQTALDGLAIGYGQYRFPIFGQIVRALIRQGNKTEAMNFLNDFLSKYQPVSTLDQQVAAATKGDCYNALGKYDLAEKYYTEMIARGKDIPAEYQTASGIVARFIQGAEAYYTMGKFYMERGRRAEAYPFFLQALDTKHYPPSLSMRRDIHLMLFKIDRAEGNLASAINHFEIHKHLNDSIFNETKSKQIEELKIKYEIASNENQLVLLRSKEHLQQEELRQAAQTRNYTYILIVALILLIALGYSRYSLKQRTNFQLRVHQQEIDHQNTSLKRLLSEQQKLVAEKEWLVREIHHRVKNNFHIVMGLLGTQSGYIKNEEAFTAIEDSKHRIHAMSLLHQKLYQSANLSAIHMPDYIYELVSNLKESFETRERIRFTVHVEQIELELSHALPIGLILNESVTNSIKYAFPAGRQGTISISLKQVSETGIALVIEDDGIGIPHDLSLRATTSMGVNLMKGLSEDMDGSFSMENHNGTRISIQFNYDPSPDSNDRSGLTLQHGSTHA